MLLLFKSNLSSVMINAFNSRTPQRSNDQKLGFLATSTHCYTRMLQVCRVDVLMRQLDSTLYAAYESSTEDWDRNIRLLEQREQFYFLRLTNSFSMTPIIPSPGISYREKFASSLRGKLKVVMRGS
eukprot:Blabericola_migrator_1__9240@NODE_4963_length_918_cov_5_978848_g3116_i0_p1_GENE_NODE_4963_length_918_cov_5_978848_g3116_i0NODE_4963_length_918_cov_5_978848_g3116_i0_p1_ORF_typecomplete_len126_score12_89_NODE_4963_length_918_cov_5_978848_g3116_i0147524